MSSSSGAGKMSSSSAHSDRDAALDSLSGPELVAHLQVTTRRADYDAAARVLDARDRRLAETVDELAKAKAALAELKTGLDSANASIQALREKYHALKAARSGPITGSSRGAIADPPPRGDGRAECADKKSDEVIDICDSSDDEDALEEGEFRPDVARVSCKAAEPTREGGEGHRAGVSCKRNAPAAHEGASESDDEDDRIPLGRLMKKRREANPVPNGVPKNGHGDAQVNSVGHLGDHPTERPLVNLGEPIASAGKRVDASPKLKEASFVQGRGRICQSREGGGLSRAMPTPPPIDSAVGRKVDGSQDGSKIGGERGSAAFPPFQVKTPTHTDMARRIVESARAVAEKPKGHAGSPMDASISLVHNTTREQGKTIGGMQKVKGPLETGGIVEKACVVSRAIRKQQETQGQVLNVDVLPATNGIGQQSGKLSMCQNREVGDGGRLMSSDKPISASLQPNNQVTLHSEQVPAHSSLATSLQPNNQLMLLSEQMPVESSLPSAVTEHWKFAPDVFMSCLENNEICLQAACALLRQRKLTIQGGRSGCTKFRKFDARRVTALVEFLLDGNLQGPLRRTSEELVKHDSYGIDLLKRVAVEFSEQLFGIFMNKEDPYFR